MIKHFSDDWPKVASEIDNLPKEEIMGKLGWTDYEAKLGEQKTVVDNWISAFEKWIQSCYPAPKDRIIKTSDKICQNGIEYSVFNDGEKASKDMWYKFVRPMLKAYKECDDFS